MFPTVWTPHVTVAAIIEQNGRYLMVEEESDGMLVINQPAGHLDPDESLHAAVVREVLEETAHHFTPEYLTGIYRWVHPNQETFMRIAFSGQLSGSDATLTLDEGIIRAEWYSLDELYQQSEKLRSPLVLRCIEDYQAGHRYPLGLLQDLTD